MNVRVLGTGKDDAARRDAAPAAIAATAADPPGAGVDEDLDEDRDPVSIGDRLRKALAGGGDKEPLYPRILRLEHVNPNGWQRALLLEGMALAGALVALADKATAWAPVVLPLGAAAVVKFHDVLAGLLPPRAAGDDSGDPGADPDDRT